MNVKEQIVATNLTERDGYADFLKYILIVLVVFGHFINLYQNTQVFGGVYAWVYTFHMPLFVFISGHFSKHINNYRQKSIDTLLWPFAVFQLLNILYTAIIPIEPLSHNIFYPYHQNWYLIALFWWRSFIPYRQFFNKRIVIVLAFVISLSVGFYPEWGGFMGLYKTAYFLPFFVLGVYCENLTVLLSKLMKQKFLWIGVLVTSIVVVTALSLDSNLLHKMNYAFKADLGYSDSWHNLLLRSLALFTSFVMCASVLVVVKLLYNSLKERRVKINGGGGTMLCFLGHEFIMIPIVRVYAQLGIVGFGLCFITSLVVTYLLTRKRIVVFFSPLLDMRKFCNIIEVNIYKKTIDFFKL